MTDPQRLLLAGDTHGDAAWVEWLCFVAEQQACDGIVQLGDFGTWPGQAGTRFLDAVDASCQDHRLNLWFLDGNHDYLEWLFRLDVDDRGLRPVRDRITHLPRGHHWTWSGVRFAALGGAYSVDQAYRVPGESWWPQETITEQETEAAMSAGPVDVMLCHDAPAGVDPLPGQRMHVIPASYANRQRVRRVADRLTPRLLVHGHYHSRYSQSLRLTNGSTTQVTGLAQEWTGARNWEVLELQS